VKRISHGLLGQGLDFLGYHGPVVDADIIDQAGEVGPWFQDASGANVQTAFLAHQISLCVFSHGDVINVKRSV
jgi:hypothetical protein